MTHIEWQRYMERRAEHRPTDPAVIAREVLRLRSSGLTPADIGSALGMDATAVRSILHDYQQAR